MAHLLITVTTGVGSLASAVAAAGLGLSIAAGGMPQQPLVGLMAAGVVVLVLGFVWHFEEQSRTWSRQVADRRRAGQWGARSVRGAATRPPAGGARRHWAGPTAAVVAGAQVPAGATGGTPGQAPRRGSGASAARR